MSTEAAEEYRRKTLQQTDEKLANHHLSYKFNEHEAAEKIILSGKLMLPKGFTHRDLRREKASQGGENGHSSGSDEESDDENEEEKEELLPGVVQVVRPKNETAEEKKLRKAAAKQSKREKRTLKKAIKTAYKDEGVKMNKLVGKAQDIDHVNVFRYTANS